MRPHSPICHSTSLRRRPCPGPHPGSQKVEMTQIQFAELNKHNYLEREVKGFLRGGAVCFRNLPT